HGGFCRGSLKSYPRVADARRHASTHDDIYRALRQLLAKTALIEFRDECAFQFIAFVEKGQSERKAGVAENFRILGPSDHRSRAHHGRKISSDERVAG